MELVIKDLHVNAGDKEILKGIDLTVKDGEIHALMGPNGNGKSTLLAAVMGHPNYTVTKGSIQVDGKEITELKTDERAKLGLFLGMQYPPELPGITAADFYRAALRAKEGKQVSLFKFVKSLDNAIETLQMDENLAQRFLNEGFSGGEKKRNEILQMLLLKPEIAMLDEIDSGLDVDALKIVADAILGLKKENENMSMVLVSHYERFFEYIHPTNTHVLMDGKIVLEGDYSLTEKIDQEGYQWIEDQYNVKAVRQEKKTQVSIGACAVKPSGEKYGE